MKSTRRSIAQAALCILGAAFLAGCTEQAWHAERAAGPEEERPGRYALTRDSHVPDHLSREEADEIHSAWLAATSGATTTREPEVVGESQGGASTKSISMAFPTGVVGSSAVLLEKRVPREVRVGGVYDYEIRVQNLTRQDIDEVRVQDRLGDNFNLLSSEPEAQTRSERLASWDLGSLAPGEVKVIRVKGRPKATGDVTTAATVTYKSEIRATSQVVEPRLAVKLQAPEEALYCDPVPLSFHVSNEGTGTIEGVTLEAALPEGWRTRAGAQSVKLQAGSLGPKQSKEFRIDVMGEDGGRLEARARATSADGLEATSNTVATTTRRPKLELRAPADQRFRIEGVVEYAVEVVNTGDGPAKICRVEHTLGEHTSCVSCSHGGSVRGRKVIWQLGTLAPGARATLSVKARGDDVGASEATFAASAYGADTDIEGMQVEVFGIPGIRLEVVDLTDPVRVGEDAVYDITVTNQGSATATNVRVSCTLEELVSFDSASGVTMAQEPAAGSPTVDLAPLATLAPKASATWKVKVKALKPGDSRFKVSLKSDQLERPVEETEATSIYE